MDVIIIDDEPKIRYGLQHFIAKQAAWNVVATFENAITALDYLEQHHVDVILTDIKMPQMNGLEMIAQIREKNLQTYVVIISGYSDFRFAQQAIELGVFRYMLKPTDPREVLQVLEQIEKSRACKKVEVVEEKTPVGNLLVRKAVEYIEENYATKISLKDVASHLYVTPNYLSNLFKHHTGENMSSYILEYRMNKAKEYLRRPEYTVKEISDMVGIETVSYFSINFKKKFGCTPSEYRNCANDAI
jgi:two-component system response regulator YesN